MAQMDVRTGDDLLQRLRITRDAPHESTPPIMQDVAQLLLGLHERVKYLEERDNIRHDERG